MKFGLGQIPQPEPIQVPAGECAMIYAYGVPEGVCVAILRTQEACGQKLQGPVCGPCGPLTIDKDEPCAVVPEGCYALKISNPEGLDLSKMAVFCYETKASPQIGVTMAANKGLSLEDVKLIVELCLKPVIQRLDAIEAVNAAQDEAIAELESCVDDLKSVGGA